MSFKRCKEKIYVSPIVFGIALNPVQDSKGKRYDNVLENVERYSIKYSVNQDDLEKLIPYMLEIEESQIIIEVECLSNVAWLSGRNFNRISVKVPVSFDGEKGLFNMVTWEDNGDSIIQDRDMRGIAKMYAKINKKDDETSITIEAENWSFKFLSITFDKSSKNKKSEQNLNSSGSTFNYRYLPRTMKPFNQPDAEYINKISPEKISNNSIQSASGTVEWFMPEFEDAPTQYYFIQKMAGLIPLDYVDASMEKFDRTDDCFDQKIVWEVK